MAVERGPGAIEPEDVETLRVMAEVQLAATGRAGEATPAPAGDLDGLADGMLDSVRRARVALDDTDDVGPIRLALHKRVFLRILRPVTFKVVVAARALSDALEASAEMQAGQLAYARRMNDSLRAMVVSADLAISDAVDRLDGADEIPRPAAAELESKVALLEARIAELEDRLAGTSGEGPG